MLFYVSRFYDPAVGRFIQADSIVPGGVQGLDRYAYVNNMPTRFTDPSGHKYCLKDEECEETIISGSGKDFFWDYEGYSDWERNVLRKLFDKGGPNAQHGVLYILENNIHIKVGNLPFNLDKDRDAWFSESTNTIVLNADLFSAGAMPNGWGLSLIIHEAKHLEQGTELSHSKLGEMEGWQVQFDVLSHFQPLTPGQQRVLNAQTLDEYVDAVQDHWPSYWFNGLWGLYTYPDYPDWIWYGGYMYYGKPWWLRLNLP